MISVPRKLLEALLGDCEYENAFHYSNKLRRYCTSCRQNENHGHAESCDWQALREVMEEER